MSSSITEPTKRETLAVGVVLVEYFSMGGMRLTKIARHTPTQAITESGSKYRLSDGHAVGGYGTAVVATDAHYAEMRHRKLVREVENAWPTHAGLKTLSDERLTAILVALTAEPKES